MSERPLPATRLAISVLPFIVLAAAWELVVRLGWIPAFVLPAPSAVVTRVLHDIQQPELRMDIVFTLSVILAGFAIATITGIVLGAFIALVPAVDQLLSPLIVAIQTIPKVAVAPLLIIWFGFGIESKIILVALIDFFPILVNAVSGFRATDARQLLLMKALRATPLQVFFKVRGFNALPFLMAGMQVAIVLSIIGAVLGEFLGSARGLGSQILQRQGSMDVIGVFSILVLLSIIGMSLNGLMHWVHRRLAFWRQASDAVGL